MNAKTKKNLIITAVTIAALLALTLIPLFITWGVSRAQYRAGASDFKRGTWDETLVWGGETLVNADGVTYSKTNAPAFDPTDERYFHVIEVDPAEEFNVLMLTDIHYRDGGWFGNWIIGQNADNDKTDRDIRQLAEETNPDLILMTGDVETGSFNDLNYEHLIAVMDEIGVPWTLTFGNHDAEHRADKPYLANLLAQSKCGIFRQGPIDLGIEQKDIPTRLNGIDVDPQALPYDKDVDSKAGGLGNTVISLKSKTTGEIVYAFILLDTGDWQNWYSNQKAKNRLSEGQRPFSRAGVGLTNRQIAWYDWVLDGLQAYNEKINADGVGMPQSAAVMHIGPKVLNYAAILGSYKDYHNAEEGYVNRDYKNNDLPFDTEAEWCRPSDRGYVSYDQSLPIFNPASNAPADELATSQRQKAAFAYNGVESKYYDAISQFWRLADETKRADYLAGRTEGYEQPMTLKQILDTLQEGYSVHKTNDYFMRKVFEKGSTKNIVTGHNHCDGYEVVFDGITYTSVVKTGDIYVDKECDLGNRGGSLFTYSWREDKASVTSKAIYTRFDNYASARYPRPVTDATIGADAVG